MRLKEALLLLSIPSVALAQSRSADEYTRYELLSPESASFRILYDVTAVTAGARFFFNPIRKGSEARDESVIDLATGAPLRFELVSGQEARDSGESSADLETHYIKVHLPRAVPEGGEVRIRIDKTYRDPKSYLKDAQDGQEGQDGKTIVFDRPLGIKKNAIVLPAGFELVSCNIPSQVIEEPDGRIAVTFMNTYPASAPLVLKAKALKPAERTARSSETASTAAGPASAPSPEPGLGDVSFPERARQETEIVYFLKQPETHSFRLYHDFTESKEGMNRYVNVVRTGSRVSEPSARLLDTGEALTTETLRGESAVGAGAISADADPDTEVVLVHFPAVKKGGSSRIRIEETYTDPNRYGVVNERLVWRRSFGRPYNDLVLPEGWFLTASSIPATVSQESDGRIRLAFVNPRPDSIDVLVTARRR